MLETDRLFLRQFTLADVNHYHRQLLGDPDVMKTLPPGKPRSREQTKAALNPRIEHWENHGFGLWAVIYKQNGEFIGHCGLQYLEDTPEVELAYAIAKAYWHQGLTTQAAKASIK